METGQSGEYRATEMDDDLWIVEAVDSNGVWVDAWPGEEFASRKEAEQAMKDSQ